MLVVDQIAPVDPLAAFELNRFERARDPSTTRVLVGGRPARAVRRERPRAAPRDIVHEPRDLEAYLDLAGCEGFERERAAAWRRRATRRVLGWFVLAR